MIFTTSLSAFVLVGMVHAHTWVEQLSVIASNGTMIGATGYPRGNVLRNNPAFGDGQMTWLLPPNGRSGPNPNAILATDLMCMPSQAIGNQTKGSPALIASPGDNVALRYQENGHVTLPATQAGKPANRGTIFIYGTTSPSNSDTLLAIHKVWTADGKGGDGRGELLATRNFDDGQCYQVNGGTISKSRQVQFKHDAVQPMGDNIWCQSDVKIPVTAPTSGAYTLYWVWEWPTAAGTAGFPKGLNETYTTCMDINMKAVSGSKNTNTNVGNPVNFKAGQDLNFAAIGSQLDNQFLVTTGISGGVAPTQAVPASATSASTSLGGVFHESIKSGGGKTATVTVSVPVTEYITVTASPSAATANSKPTDKPIPLAESGGSIIVPLATKSGSSTRIRTATSTSTQTTLAESPASPSASASLNVQPFTVTSMLPTTTTTLQVASIAPSSAATTLQTRIASSALSSTVDSKVRAQKTVTDWETKTVYASPSATLRGRVVQIEPRRRSRGQ